MLTTKITTRVVAVPVETDRTEIRPFNRATINLYPTAEETSYIRSLPEIIDFNAEKNPDHVFCIQAEKSAEDGFSLRCVTNAQVQNATAECAQWLQSTIAELQLPSVGDDGIVTKGRPVALLMESDVGLFIHEQALIGLGVPVLLLSARLSATAVHHLVNKTGSCSIIASKRLRGTAAEAVQMMDEGRKVSLYSHLSYDVFVPKILGERKQSVSHPNHYFRESDRDVLILHSSGTTGLPKPIYVSHRHLVCFLSCHAFSSDKEANGVNVSTLPLYHGFGLVGPAMAMSVGKTLCLPPTSIVSNAKSTVDLIKAAKAASIMSVPSILEDISLMPDNQGIQALVKLDFVTFGGGILKDTVGERLAAGGVQLLNHYGTTESGPLSPIFVPTPDYNWRFFRLRKDMKMQMTETEPQGGQRRFKLTTFPFGWETPFEIQDQLVCNPDHPDSDFNAVGRNDDWIVLATGEKVIPHILESMLFESGLVKTAVAFGEHHFEIGVIVEPTVATSVDQHDALKSALWPIVQRAGEKMDDHAKISSPDAIIVARPGTVIPRTDKGSISRKEVYKLFESEISQAYRDLENVESTLVPLDVEKLEEELKDWIQHNVKWDVGPEDWTDNDDLFELGMDSLQATRLRRLLLSAFPMTDGRERIGRDFVYTNPTVRGMANALRSLASGGEQVSNLARDIDQFVERYSLKPSDSKAVILLTGASGSLGSHTVARLAGLKNVTRIICLNRQGRASEVDARERQKQSLSAKGIQLSPDEWAKVHVYQTSTASERLGLTETEYAMIRNSVTHILHTAWPMDFKWKLPSFSSQFQTLNNLLALAEQVHANRPLRKPRLLLISSIATVGRYASVNGGCIIPEIPVQDVDCANPIGYAVAKLICERMIERAITTHTDVLEASYIRVGQLAGSKNTGFWSTAEHFSALVKSSQGIGKLPELRGTLSWIPVDDAAAVLSDLLLSPNPLDLVYHLENPIRQSWTDVLRTLATELSLQQSVPFDQWLREVNSAVDGDGDENPVPKLAEFFEQDFERMACGHVILGTDITRKASITLRNLDAVSADVVVGYVKYWRTVGYLK